MFAPRLICSPTNDEDFVLIDDNPPPYDQVISQGPPKSQMLSQDPQVMDRNQMFNSAPLPASKPEDIRRNFSTPSFNDAVDGSRRTQPLRSHSSSDIENMFQTAPLHHQPPGQPGKLPFPVMEAWPEHQGQVFKCFYGTVIFALGDIG